MYNLNLTETLKSETDLTKKESTAVVDLFFDEMATALASGDRVEIRGLCTFFRQEIQRVYWT